MESLIQLKFFVVAVVDGDKAVGSLPLLWANVVPGTLGIDLELPPVDNTVGSLNMLIIGVLHVLPSVGKVLDDMLCTK